VIGNNPFETATAADLVDAVAARYPTREAIVFADDRVTFADLRDRSRRLARGLAAVGIRAGDRVGIWLPNRPA
jgi:fatty-acyl-CoA synthase